MKLDPTFLRDVKEEYRRRHAIKPRMASAYLREVCEKNNLKYGTLHKHLELGVRAPREQAPDVQLRRNEIDGYARMVWELVRSNSFDDHKLSVTVAYRHLRKKGSIPERFSLKAIYDSIDRQNLKRLSQPVHRDIKWGDPMSMWQLDFSKSAYFRHVPQSIGDVQCLNPTFTKRQGDGYSLMFGSAVDTGSRVMYLQYFVDTGENADAVIEFCLNALEKKSATLLQGKPTCFYVDNGSGWVDGRTEEGLRKMRIKRVLGGYEKDSTGRKLEKRNKSGRGMVERSVRTIKECFEAEAHLEFGHGRKLTVRELNEFASNWIANWNKSSHPKQRDESKWTVYLAIAGEQLENLEYPADNARALFSSAVMAKVIRGRIQVGIKNKEKLYALAPSFCNHGDSVEIVHDQTGYYVYADGQSHKLTLDTPQDRLESKRVKETERKDAVLSGHDLRTRYGQQLLTVFGMTFGDFFSDEDLWEDSKDFFEKARRVDEIEEHVAMLKLRLSVRGEGGMPATISTPPPAPVNPVVTQPPTPRAVTPRATTPNIIQLPKEYYVGNRE